MENVHFIILKETVKIIYDVILTHPPLEKNYKLRKNKKTGR